VGCESRDRKFFYSSNRCRVDTGLASGVGVRTATAVKRPSVRELISTVTAAIVAVIIDIF